MSSELAQTVNRWNYHRLGYRRLLHGVYGPTQTPTGNQYTDRRRAWLAKAKAALALYPNANPVLYGSSALQAMGAALPHGAEDWNRVHILIDHPAGRSQRADVISHDGLARRPVWRTFAGLPVLNPVDRWLQMRHLTIDELVEIGDGFLRRQHPLLTIQEMSSRLAELTGHHGIAKAGRAMALVRSGTDSIYESKTRLIMVHSGLPTPKVNPEVWCESVAFFYHVDLGYVHAKVGIEFDGQGHSSREQMDIDADRHRNLQDAGWMIIKVTATQLQQPDAFIHSIWNAVVMRAPDPRDP